MKLSRWAKVQAFFFGMLLWVPALLASEGEAGKAPKTAWQIFHEGGIVMWILLIASILIMAFTIEAFIKIRGGSVGACGSIGPTQRRDCFRKLSVGLPSLCREPLLSGSNCPSGN